MGFHQRHETRPFIQGKQQAAPVQLMPGPDGWQKPFRHGPPMTDLPIMGHIEQGTLQGMAKDGTIRWWKAAPKPHESCLQAADDSGFRLFFRDEEPPATIDQC